MLLQDRPKAKFFSGIWQGPFHTDYQAFVERWLRPLSRFAVYVRVSIQNLIRFLRHIGATMTGFVRFVGSFAHWLISRRSFSSKQAFREWREQSSSAHRLTPCSGSFVNPLRCESCSKFWIPLLGKFPATRAQSCFCLARLMEVSLKTRHL